MKVNSSTCPTLSDINDLKIDEAEMKKIYD